MCDELAKAADMVLAWLSMSYKGTHAELPREEYQHEELNLRCIELREQIAKYKESKNGN